MVQRMKIEGEGGELAELEQLIYDDVSRRHPSTSNSIAYNFSSYHSTVKHVIDNSNMPPLIRNVDVNELSLHHTFVANSSTDTSTIDKTTKTSERKFLLVDDEEVDVEDGATTESNKSHVDGHDIISAQASVKDRIGLSNEGDDIGIRTHDYANAPIADKWETLGDDRSSPVIGKVDPKKLLVQLRNKKTGVLAQYQYGGGKMSEIDWNNQNDINAITHWRRLVFRSKGLRRKTVNVRFHPTEDAWLKLFVAKVKLAIENGHIVKIPTYKHTTARFNDFFEGRVLQDKNGKDLPPREAREPSSLHRKLTRKGSSINNDLAYARKLLKGADTAPRELYMPIITTQELEEYKSEGLIQLDDPRAPSKNVALSFQRRKNRHSPGH